MKPKAIIVGILLCTIFAFNSNAQQDEFPVLKGSYLGQNPPGITAEIFASGIISTGYHDGCITFSPDGKELFYHFGGLG